MEHMCGERHVWVCVGRSEQVGDGSVFVRADVDVGGETPARERAEEEEGAVPRVR